MSRGPSALMVVLVAVLAGGAGALTAMLWPEGGLFENSASDSPSITSAGPRSPESPSASFGVSIGPEDFASDPSPLAIDGELLPVGFPVEADPVDVFGDVHPMALTIDGVSQRGDCTVVLLRVTPTGPLDTFSIPNVGIVSDGQYYDAGGCETTGLEDAGYVSSFDVRANAGEVVTYYDFAQNPGGSLEDVDAVTVELSDGKYLFFEPTAATLP